MGNFTFTTYHNIGSSEKYHSLPFLVEKMPDKMNFPPGDRKPQKFQCLSRLFDRKKLQKILECPVCLKIPFSPTKIFTCINGHIICETCKPNVKTCAICRSKLTNTRSFSNEQIIATSEFHCKNQDLGCQVVRIGEEMLKHHRQCNFRPFNCLEDTCNVRLHPSNCLEHFISVHKMVYLRETARGFRDVLVLYDDVDTDTNTDTADWPCSIFTCNELSFITKTTMKAGRLHFEIFSVNPLPDDGGNFFVKIDFLQDEKLKYSVMVSPAPVALHNKSGMNAYIPAIIVRSVWEKMQYHNGGEVTLSVLYNVVKL